jgi:hypothetical protein
MGLRDFIGRDRYRASSARFGKLMSHRVSSTRSRARAGSFISRARAEKNMYIIINL